MCTLAPGGLQFKKKKKEEKKSSLAIVFRNFSNSLFIELSLGGKARGQLSNQQIPRGGDAPVFCGQISTIVHHLSLLQCVLQFTIIHAPTIVICYSRHLKDMLRRHRQGESYPITYPAFELNSASSCSCSRCAKRPAVHNNSRTHHQAFHSLPPPREKDPDRRQRALNGEAFLCTDRTAVTDHRQRHLIRQTFEKYASPARGHAIGTKLLTKRPFSGPIGN